MPTKVKGTTGVDKVESGAVITNPAFSGDATVSGSLTVGGVNVFSGPYRNLIINGDMRIAQRGASATGITVSGYYTVDRWTPVLISGGTWTNTQDTDVPTGQGFANSFKLECTTAVPSLTAGAVGLFRQAIEGQNLQQLKKGTANAESITLSFWVKSNKIGTYICELYDADNTRAISKAYTVDTADTWEKKTITYAGDTTGAFVNDNTLGLFVQWWLAAGSDRSSGTLQTSWASVVNANRAVGQVNLADSTSNYINITGVQLEVGEGASDFEFLPYDMELQRCQRYFTKSYEGAISAASAAADSGYERLVLVSDGIGVLTSYFPVHMRTTPDIVIRNTSDGATGQITGVNSVDYAGEVKAGNDRVVTIGPTNIGDRTRVLGFHYEASAEL